jgi:hypothetical protein
LKIEAFWPISRKDNEEEEIQCFPWNLARIVLFANLRTEHMIKLHNNQMVCGYMLMNQTKILIDQSLIEMNFFNIERKKNTIWNCIYRWNREKKRETVRKKHTRTKRTIEMKFENDWFNQKIKEKPMTCETWKRWSLCTINKYK